MKINPGGKLNIEDVIGRDTEIERYWRALAQQSLILSAERRIGKTHILKKMEYECTQDYIPLYQDLEGVHSIDELVNSIYRTIREHTDSNLSLDAFIAKLSGWIPSKISGFDTSAAKNLWPSRLVKALDNLAQTSNDRKVLMLWDEFPLMLDNIQKSQGPAVAIKLLDHLREFRFSRNDRIRFILTGSVGLHLILRSLRSAGQTNAPVNDMLAVEVKPLSEDYAVELATNLLSETSAAAIEIPYIAKQIVQEVEGFPYFIHHVVDQLDQLPGKPTREDVSRATGLLIYGSDDPANLNYYVERMSSYYSRDQQTSALKVLDVIAGLESPEETRNILNLCRHSDSGFQDEKIRETLRILIEDHYLKPCDTEESVKYDFRWRLVKEWWRRTRL